MKDQLWQDETVQALKQGYQEIIDKQAAEIEKLKEWKLAIDEACVINWVNMTTPKETVNNLIAWNVKMALDPAISEQPAKWVARITELEEIIKRIEWGGSDEKFQCPECKNFKEQGHRYGCYLNNHLRGEAQ